MDFYFGANFFFVGQAYLKENILLGKESFEFWNKTREATVRLRWARTCRGYFVCKEEFLFGRKFFGGKRAARVLAEKFSLLTKISVWEGMFCW